MRFHLDAPAGRARNGFGRRRRFLHNERVRALSGDRSRQVVVTGVFPLLGLVMLGLAIAIDVVTPATGPGVDLAPGFGSPYAATGAIFGLCSGVVLAQNRRQAFGWVLGGIGVFWSLDGLAQSYVRFGIRQDEVLAGINLALWFLNRIGAFLPMTLALMLLIFPTGALPTGRWGTIGRATLATMALAGLLAVLAPANGRVTDVALPPGVDLDAGSLPLPVALIEVALPAAVLMSVLGVLVAMASVVARYRASAGLERDRLRWLAWAVVVMAVLISLSSFSDLSAVRDGSLFLLTVLPAIAMTIGIVKPQVVPVVDLLLGTLVFSVLAVVLVAVDLLIVAAIDLALADSLSQKQVVLVVLLPTVLLYGPLRMRLSVLIRRLVLGERDAPYDVVANLASTLERSDEPAEALAAVAEAVASTFGIGYVRVEVDRLDGARMTATRGTRPHAVRELPIIYRDQEVGRVVLPVRGLRSWLSSRDEQLLADLVRQAVTALRTSQLAAALQDNRERLVVAREEERRRIRRDLHDGLGPSLSGVVYQLESARLLVAKDPVAARETIETLSGHVQDVVADVRRLVHDLRPPALDDRGLVGALTQLAERMGVEGTAVRVEADDLGSLPAAVEVAVFRIVGEALTNIGRHAAAETASVRLVREPATLLVEVADDGVGIAPEAQAGVGLISLRERAAELGGRSEVLCPPSGGTLVRAWLPLSYASEATSS